MDWYYAKDGQQLGPVTQPALIELRQTGQITDSDLVWNDSMPEWLAYGSVNELAGTASAAPVDTSPSYGSQPQQPENVAPTPAAGSSGAAAPAHQPSGGEIPNYLWQSIVVLILCCWPFAIPALVYS
ncbi:MAG: GYF domain-containing protein, partial [Planctomycetota bacterium]